MRVVGGKIIRLKLERVFPGLMYARCIPESVSLLLSLRVTAPVDGGYVCYARVSAATRGCRCVFSFPALT